jgi:LytS/YehU family sensor histidine kinase
MTHLLIKGTWTHGRYVVVLVREPFTHYFILLWTKNKHQKFKTSASSKLIVVYYIPYQLQNTTNRELIMRILQSRHPSYRAIWIVSAKHWMTQMDQSTPSKLLEKICDKFQCWSQMLKFVHVWAHNHLFLGVGSSIRQLTSHIRSTQYIK